MFAEQLLEWREIVKKINWLLVVIGILLSLCQPDYAYAASAALELQCLTDEIYKEEQFYNDRGWPTESFRYSRYRLNQNGEEYDE